MWIGVKMKEKFINKLKVDTAFFLLSILAGIMIAIGGMTYLYITSFDSSIWLKIAGGFSFTIGLVFIILLKFKLFTGLNCDLIYTNYKDWYKLILAFLGNCVGCWIGSLLIFKTAIGPAVMERAVEVSIAKLNTELWVVLLSAILCGVFITMAVLGYRACKNSKTAGIIAIVFPIFTFTILGVEHSVANQVYFALTALSGNGFSGKIVLHTFIVMIGNIIGGILIPLVFWAKDKLTKKNNEIEQSENEEK